MPWLVHRVDMDGHWTNLDEFRAYRMRDSRLRVPIVTAVTQVTYDQMKGNDMSEMGVLSPAAFTTQEEATYTVERRSQGPRTIADTFVPFLSSQPPLTDVAQFLVALLSWPIGAQGAIITDGRLGRGSVLGAYIDSVQGWHDEQGRDPFAGIQDALDAVTGGQPIIWTSEQEIGRWPIVAWPLGSFSGPVGALVLILGRPMDQNTVFDQVRDLASALSLYLAGLTVKPTGQVASRSLGGLAFMGVADARDLTPRQIEILGWMAKGLTMRQIGHRIGFSDSTVRAESLAIYRTLGVNDRAAALARAHEIGVLTDSIEAQAS